LKEELELKLVKKYPKIFRNYKGDPAETAMAWGITCGDGWYNIIDCACQKLSELSDTIYAEQIKEKFGMLRFYTSREEEEVNEEIQKKIRDIINEAEDKSAVTCEDCGGPNDKIRAFRHRIYGICESCFTKMKEEMVKFTCSVCGKECTEVDGNMNTKVCWGCQYKSTKKEKDKD